jgi:Primase C terminal 2 (PriCT-2)/Protein of unknown function (DUF3987)/RepB DNA-primase from phage plasmid
VSLTASSSAAFAVPPPPIFGQNAPARDREQTRRFLRLLDPAARSFTFQTFDDDRSNGHATNSMLARDTSDRLEVVRLYGQGAGVFITVNETDLTGRKSENITRVRAVWQEDDDGHGGPFPLDPSLVVESSPGHFHRYWQVSDHWPADDRGRGDFAAVMARMVTSYGSDHRAKDISRVLRLPGFLHRKDPTRPHTVRIIEESNRRYTREQILRAFPPVEREARQHSNDWRSGNSDEERIAEALRVIPSDDRDTWLQVGMAVKDALGDRGRSLWDNWSAGSSKFDQKDQEKTWRSIRRNGITVATVFYLAQQHGWSPPRAVERPTSVASVAYVAPPAAIWPTMDGAAYHGLAGDVVHTIEPHTEADPVAVLIQVLIYFGNIVGGAPYYLIEADKHHTNLYGVLVGATSKARKGTSDGRARSVFTEADAQWVEDRIRGGLSSGEGFIDPIRDEVRKWNAKEQQFEIIDPGITDKRLMVVEAEFAGALTAMERPGNTLSVMVRKAWDGHKLATMTRHSPIKVTAPHVSIIGHSTQDDIRAGLTRTDAANGFANRFIFACIKRSKTLPHGGNLSPETIQALATRIKQAVEHASKAGRLTMTPEARETWEAVYPTLSAGQAGLLGAITARGEAQVIRLSLVYALLDGAEHVDVPHLKAALAVWEYCEASAAYIFGNALGDPVADEISIALQHAGRDGMSRTAIRDLFGRHRSSDRVGVALALLVTKGRARVEHQTSGGRPVEMWFASHG